MNRERRPERRPHCEVFTRALHNSKQQAMALTQQWRKAHGARVSNGDEPDLRTCAARRRDDEAEEEFELQNDQQHGHTCPLTVPQLVPCASSGRAWRLLAVQYFRAIECPATAPEKGAQPLRPATAAGARASRLRSRRFYRLGPFRPRVAAFRMGGSSTPTMQAPRTTCTARQESPRGTHRSPSLLLRQTRSRESICCGGVWTSR